MRYADLISTLGYAGAPLFCEDGGAAQVALSDRHWLRDARAAGVRGSYLFRTSPAPGALRAAVHVAEASSVEEARQIHRRLWNQGGNPFVVVALPGQVRAFTGFAYHPDFTREDSGEICTVPDRIEDVRNALSAFTADAIDRGEVWRENSRHLRSNNRVDTTLLKQLRELGRKLRQEHGIVEKTGHSLIGKFVYLSYLRARDILSDEWLRDDARLDPRAIFSGEVFSPELTLKSFRRLARAVETRFNGLLFPIPWGSPRAPRAGAIRTVARVFAGEDIISGQLHLPFTAYDFSSIPVELLSTIYEQFLHAEGRSEEDEDDTVEDRGARERNEVSAPKKNASDPETRGAHYTPEPLADYLVSEMESVRPLKAGMRILDPCCGSGIFLVAAYRRLVELECRRQERDRLDATDLRDILVHSIFGVERNRTACQIAAFSLILTLLSYVDPPELHAQTGFKFPSLTRDNLFGQDFFDESKSFWKRVASGTTPANFDWIVGNPPWVELDYNDRKEGPIVAWLEEYKSRYELARARTGEAFAWRVMDCIAENGTVGLILHAKTLTNDHLKGWRQKFFGGVAVRRMTNFSNLAYVIFPSAEQPAVTLVYSPKVEGAAPHAIQHFGPFVANQATVADTGRTRRRVWTISFSESEVTAVDPLEAASGSASVWKLALWGNQRDRRTIQRLQHIWPTTLGELVKSRGWHLSLGLTLRRNEGTKKDPSVYVKALEGLKVLNHDALLSARRLEIPERCLVDNSRGCFVRKRSGQAGLQILRGPHLFLWLDFAAFGENDFIIRHDKIGLSGGSTAEMKAVAAVWSSSYISYLLFFVYSAAWGIGYSTIDKGDAEDMPFPELTPERVQRLAHAWDAAVKAEKSGASFDEVKGLLDEGVSEVLGLPASISLIVRELFRVRYQLNKGKSPPSLSEAPDETEMKKYAARLQAELDGFLAGKANHAIIVRHSVRGISASIRLLPQRVPVPPQVRRAEGQEAATLEGLLRVAERQFCQWVYVKRSVRIFDGDTVHLVKPPRRLEWTETQALLDADDIIAEVLETRARAS